MHICPQEVMLLLGGISALKPTIGLVKYWCQSCFDGTHKSCEDHAAEQEMKSNELAHE